MNTDMGQEERRRGGGEERRRGGQEERRRGGRTKKGREKDMDIASNV